MFTSYRLSRRGLLKSASLAVAGTILAACQPKIVEVTKIVEKEKVVEKPVEKVVKETVVVQGTPQVVEKVVTAKPQPSSLFKGELSLWHDWGNTGGGGLAMLDQVEAFTKKYPEVKMVNVFDANQQKWMAALASGNVPDLLKLNAPNIPTLAQNAALMSLDPLIQRDNWNLKQYFDFAVDQCSWRKQLYAMTHHPDVRVFFRNRAVFKEVGLDPEKEPASWDDIMQWGGKMSKKEGNRYVRFGFVASWTSNPWPIQYMLANGVQLLSEDGHKATFNSDKAVEAMEWCLKAVDTICGGRDNTVEFQEVNATPQGKGPYWMFPHHRMGMVLFGNWLFYPVSVVNKDMEIGIGMFPGGPSNVKEKFVFGGGTMVSIPTGAKHWELAWEWLKFLGGPEGAALVQARTSDVSGRIETAKDPEVLKKHVGRAALIPLFERANRLHYVKSPISQQFDTEMTRLGDKILLKELKVKDALAAASTEVQKALDAYWATA